MPDLKFDIRKEIPDLTGKVILITGGPKPLLPSGALRIVKAALAPWARDPLIARTSMLTEAMSHRHRSIGNGTLLELAQHNPAHILFTGRNAKSAEAVIALAPKGVKLTFVPCDMTDNAAVASAAERILSVTPDRLDRLVCCAGIMGKPAGLSKDGYEISFATNQLSHSILIRKLLPLLQKTATQAEGDARIVLVTSLGFKGTPPGGIQFDRLKSEQDLPMLGQWLRYGQSKLANLLNARDLAIKYPNILSCSPHPVVVKTNLVTGLTFSQKLVVYLPNIGSMLTPEQGTYNLLWAITTKRENLKNGAFYEPVGKLSNEKTKASEDPALQNKLWEWTETEIARYL